MATFFGGLGHSSARHSFDADSSIELAVNNAKDAVHFVEIGHPAQGLNKLLAATSLYGMYLADVTAAGGPSGYQEGLAKEFGKLRQKAFDAIERVLQGR